MEDYYSDNQPELKHCDNCGEDYAATYKACPFCNTNAKGKKVGGGKRANGKVKTNKRGGGYGGARSPLSVIGIVLTVLLIIAALIIVIYLVKQQIDAKKNAGAESTASVSTEVTSQVASPAEKEEEPEAETEPVTEDSIDSEETKEETEPVIINSPDALTLSHDDVTLGVGESFTITATLTPSDWDGQVIWSSGDGAVATVDQTGAVTYVAAGTCTITATAGEVTASCVVRCQAASQEEAQEMIDEANADKLKITYGGSSIDDATLNVGETVPFKADGGEGDYTWSIGDSSIATVDNGNCKAVAAGTTTLTVTSGSETASVTIRVVSQ